MRLSHSSVIVSCLLVALSSAWPSRDANRNDVKYECSNKCYANGVLNIWCDNNNDQEHTMCLPSAEPTKSDATPVCQGADHDIVFRGINKVGQNSILKHLNTRRDEVAGGDVTGQPKAANMKKLVWNDELGKIAQRWADQCLSAHDSGHRAMSDSEKSMPGQNGYFGDFTRTDEKQIQKEYDDLADFYKDLYDLEEDSDRASASASKPHVYWYPNNNIVDESSITKDELMAGMGNWTEPWFKEHLSFTQADEKYQFVKATGHYTQDVWAQTEEVGCGWNFFTVGKEGTKTSYKSYMFCNFYPAGNQNGEYIYETGEGASNCPAGFSKDAEYPNLCSK